MLAETAKEKSSAYLKGSSSQKTQFCWLDQSAKQTDAVAQILHHTSRFPLLTFEEEQSLARLSKCNTPEGKRAFQRLWLCNQRLVIAIAKKHINCGVEFEVLIQEGVIGLKRAIELFEPDRGLKFSTYAYMWIKQAIKRSLDNDARTIRLPIHIHDAKRKLKKKVRQLATELDRQPTKQELADSCGKSIEWVDEILSWTNKIASLDLKIGESKEDTLFDIVRDGKPQPVDTVYGIEMQEQIKKLLNLLTQRERKVIELRFGLTGQPEMSLHKVGLELNLSKERVRQIQDQAMRKLRKLKVKPLLGELA